VYVVPVVLFPIMLSVNPLAFDGIVLVILAHDMTWYARGTAPRDDRFTDDTGTADAPEFTTNRKPLAALSDADEFAPSPVNVHVLPSMVAVPLL
jgi:hypothetical protein